MMTLQELKITSEDIQVIKMLLYREAIKNKNASGKWSIERDIFNKLYPITKEKLY